MAVKIDEYANEPLVVIKPKAYLTMVKHVLTYGNKYLENSVEVMGICYGKEEDGQLIQYEAVPISHGGAIEVDFSPEDYAAFAIADEKMAEKGYYAIGWYHSHPGLKAFFSKVDIKNHLFYQKEQTPYAYGIVFDHTYFDSGEENLKFGFKAFRLDDYKKGINSDYHEIKYEVELPDDLSFYTEIDEIIEDMQRKQPLIKEARETMEGLGTWEVEEEKEEDFISETKDQFEGVKQGMDEAFSGLKNQVFNPLLTDLKEFTGDTQTAALKGPTVMIKTLEEMRDAIDSGLARVRNYFEQTLEKEISDVSKSIEETIKTYSRNEMEIPKQVKSIINDLTDNLGDVIGEQLEISLKGVIAQMSKVATEANKIVQSQNNIAKKVEAQDKTLNEFPNAVDSKLKELQESAGQIPKAVNASISKRTDALKLSVDDLKETTQELKNIVDELSKILLSKRK